MTRNATVGFSLALLAIVTLTGCKSFDGQKVRRDHAESYRQELAQKTAETLETGEPLTLDDCIRIALENSLEIKSAEIEARIAKLGRKTAFANFLPAVNLNYQYTHFDPQVVMKIGGFEAARSDKRVREVTWDIQMSIFKRRAIFSVCPWPSTNGAWTARSRRLRSCRRSWKRSEPRGWLARGRLSRRVSCCWRGKSNGTAPAGPACRPRPIC